ncbi:ankyrin-3-like [Coccinella septempunctata]|uniref:ankyrin-3-like n=1 Tax=Coccinella septempunctata TaxID=41139 RepID=UPI001D06E4D6|nr:ankyrin-3-like [Coccinella septempunctata]
MADFAFANEKITLHGAVQENDASLVRKLLNEGADVNYMDINSGTPLHAAAENGNIEITQILLEYRADIRAKDKYGRTTIDTAFWNGGEALASALLEELDDINISINNRDDTPLHLAVELGYPELVKAILKRGGEVNAKKYRGKTPLHVACAVGNGAIARSLLEFGADYNCKDENGDSPLLIASRHGNEDVVRALLNYDVDVNVRVRRGESALHFLIEKKVSEKTVRLLLNKGAEVDVGSIINRTPLHICAIYGQADTAEALLEYNAYPNFQDTNGQIPLHLACMQGNESVIRLLISYGSSLNLKNELGKTPLHYAVLFGCNRIVELLLLEGADPNVRNIDGRTPLAYSVCEVFNCEMVSTLILFGADVNCFDKYGLTPLHIASRASGKDMVSLLLELGADINATDAQKRTPLDIALNEADGNQAVISLLKHHLVMRSTAGLYVCKENLYHLDIDEELEYFQEICREEVEKMKNLKLGGSRISYHDVLTKSIHNLVRMVKNDDVVRALEEDYQYLFPLYGNITTPIIKQNFAVAVERRNLLDKSIQFFNLEPKLPQNCIDLIFMYLCNADMMNWIVAFEK